MTAPIVVVGGGFAGFWAAVAARRVAPAVGVALVSRSPMLEMRPRLYEAEPERLQVDLRPLLRRIDVIEAEAKSIEVFGRRLVLHGAPSLSYAKLVVATGSRICRPPLPGDDRAYAIDTVAEAVAFDRRLADIAAAAVVPTIAVVGAASPASSWRSSCAIASSITAPTNKPSARASCSSTAPRSSARSWARDHTR
jgi:NADH dehydrogenase